MFHMWVENGSLTQSVRQTQSACQELFTKVPEGKEKSPDSEELKCQK